MPNGPSKLRHMERAKSSNSSSSEASDGYSRERQDGGRHTPRSQSANSTDRTKTTDTAVKGGQTLFSDIESVGEDGRSAESGYEAGDEAKSAAIPEESVQGGRDTETGGDVQGPVENDMRRIGQGGQLLTSNRFSDSGGNVDVDAIQDDHIRALGLEPVEPSSRAASHMHPELGQSGSITRSAASTRRRREDDEDEHDLRKAKRPRIEGS